MSENCESNGLLSDRSEIKSDLSDDPKCTTNIENLIKVSTMENSPINSQFENAKFNSSEKYYSSEDLIKKLTFNKNSEKDPRRFIKITEIIEINDLIDSDTNNLIKPTDEFTMSNHSETMFNSLNRRINQSISMSSSHSFDSSNRLNQTSRAKELPIKIETCESNTNNKAEPVQNTEIVLEILNAVSSLETVSKKPKKIIVKITGRTKSNEPNSSMKEENFDKKNAHYQHENLSQYAPKIKPHPIKIGNRVPFYNFKPISKQDLHEKNDQRNEHIFNLEKFKSYFNNLSKSNSSRSFSMPPNAKSEEVGFQFEKGLDISNNAFQNRSSFKKINRNLNNLNRDYACSDSEDSIWTYRSKNDSLKKNFVRSNSTILKNFSDKESIESTKDFYSTISKQNSPIKNEALKLSKRKDIDLYQESLRRNFAKSDKKYDKFFDNSFNTKNISSYYNKFNSCSSDSNKVKSENSSAMGDSKPLLLGEEKNNFEKFNMSLNESDGKETEAKNDLEKSVKHFNHNNRQCLSTFLPIKNSQHLSQIRSHSANVSPHTCIKSSRRVIFADELN